MQNFFVLRNMRYWEGACDTAHKEGTKLYFSHVLHVINAIWGYFFASSICNERHNNHGRCTKQQIPFWLRACLTMREKKKRPLTPITFISLQEATLLWGKRVGETHVHTNDKPASRKRQLYISSLKTPWSHKSLPGKRHSCGPQKCYNRKQQASLGPETFYSWLGYCLRPRLVKENKMLMNLNLVVLLLSSSSNSFL